MSDGIVCECGHYLEAHAILGDDVMWCQATRPGETALCQCQRFEERPTPLFNIVQQALAKAEAPHA